MPFEIVYLRINGFYLQFIVHINWDLLWGLKIPIYFPTVHACSNKGLPKGNCGIGKPQGQKYKTFSAWEKVSTWGKPTAHNMRTEIRDKAKKMWVRNLEAIHTVYFLYHSGTCMPYNKSHLPLIFQHGGQSQFLHELIDIC